MTDDPQRGLPISPHFREAATALAKGLSLVLSRMDERDECEIGVTRLEAELTAARGRLAVYERRLEQAREMMQPQLKLHLTTMEEEAQTNVAHLRSIDAAAS